MAENGQRHGSGGDGMYEWWYDTGDVVGVTWVMWWTTQLV